MARRLGTDAPAGELRDAVLELVGDPQVAARLAKIKSGMAGEGGTRRAADLIEAELPSR